MEIAIASFSLEGRRSGRLERARCDDRHERRVPSRRDAESVEGAINEARVALGAFRALTRGYVTGPDPLAPLAASSCAAEHFAVLACMHARRGASHACAGYVVQAIAHEAAVLGADGPLRPVLVRFLGALDVASVAAN